MTFPEFLCHLGRVCRRTGNGFVVRDHKSKNHYFTSEEEDKALNYAVRLVASRFGGTPESAPSPKPRLTLERQKNGRVVRVWK